MIDLMSPFFFFIYQGWGIFWAKHQAIEEAGRRGMNSSVHGKILALIWNPCLHTSDWAMASSPVEKEAEVAGCVATLQVRITSIPYAFPSIAANVYVLRELSTIPESTCPPLSLFDS